MRCRH